MSLVNGVVVAMPPPDGYVVDFDNPQRNMVASVYGVSGVGMFLAVAFLGQRLFVKLHIHHALGFDDICVIISWACTVAMQAMILMGFVKGYNGTHIWEQPIEQFAIFVMYATYIQAIVYVFPTMFSKLALLIFYIKLGNRERWYVWSTWATIAVVVGSNLGLLFSIIFACKPISKGWDIMVQGGSCINQAAVFKATAIFGIITDIMIFAIPIPMVIKLHLSRRKKIGLFILFAIGSVTVVTSIVRLHLLIDGLSQADISWLGGPVYLWICVEANLLVMCACLPTLKFFFQTVAPSLFGSSFAKTGSGSAPIPSNYRSGGTGGGMGGSSNKTFGSKPRRSQYHGFDDEDDRAYRMDVLVERGGSNQRISGDKDRDDDSAKAIIQTKTLQIDYEDRREERN